MRPTKRPTPSLETLRLRLDPLRPSDATEMVEVLGERGLYLFIGGESSTLAELEASYRSQVAGHRHRSRLAMCVLLIAIGIGRLVAHIHPDHIASGKVASTLGLHRTGEIDSDGEVVWALDVGEAAATS